ncbi:hypothetical protein ABZ192_11810 [Streptomyces sp. NPDC006235]|uniref:hypothetical protein n=1 Tax=Streptomyces sp. NPDC006235 TaxID=3156736 RepID=UPI0033AB8FCD
MTTGEALRKHVPIIAEHDTWISVDPIIGCPANCAYCYLGPIGLKAQQPRPRVTPGRAVEMLCEYLDETRGDLSHDMDSTPVCLGNYTDMLLTATNQEYLRGFASELAGAGLARPLVVVTKGRMPRALAEALDALNIAIVVFCSQSFHRTTMRLRTERGPVLTPDETFDAGFSCRDFDNITMVHFWRPIVRSSVPSADWAIRTVRRLKASEYRCSVAIGLSAGAGIAQQELIETGLLEGRSRACDEMWDDGAWADINTAAAAVGYPVYRSTSCAIALATGKAEALGVWDHRRGAAEQCLPCNCPTAQRALCRSQTLQPEVPDEPLSWIASQLGGSTSRLEVLPGRRVRTCGKAQQSLISLTLHKYQIELLPESISAERAWLGRFGREGGND